MYHDGLLYPVLDLDEDSAIHLGSSGDQAGPLLDNGLGIGELVRFCMIGSHGYFFFPRGNSLVSPNPRLGDEPVCMGMGIFQWLVFLCFDFSFSCLGGNVEGVPHEKSVLDMIAVNCRHPLSSGHPLVLARGEGGACWFPGRTLLLSDHGLHVLCSVSGYRALHLSLTEFLTLFSFVIVSPYVLLSACSLLIESSKCGRCGPEARVGLPASPGGHHFPVHMPLRFRLFHLWGNAACPIVNIFGAASPSR